MKVSAYVGILMRFEEKRKGVELGQPEEGIK